MPSNTKDSVCTHILSLSLAFPIETHSCEHASVASWHHKLNASYAESANYMHVHVYIIKIIH